MPKKEETRLFVKPKNGLNVLKEISKLGRKEFIKEDGEFVENSRFFRRLIKRGELIVSTPKTDKKTS